MANILNDKDIKRLLGEVITGGDETCIRPNSYILRLGAEGKFINTRKEFEIGKKKKGLKIQPGHSVGITAHETLDFRREAVHKVFPNHDLHAIVSPTTDLSREGIIAPTTQVDAGYHGTLNWTITNSSSAERCFIHKERIYRLTIFLLKDGERPEHLYAGEYQSQKGLVTSKRSGPPVGMEESEWEDAQIKGSPENILEDLIKSGYPWNILGSRLKKIDEQFKSVTAEYSSIHDAITDLSTQVRQMRERQGDTPETIRRILKEESSSMQNRWLICSGALLFGVFGVGMSVVANPTILEAIKQYEAAIGLGSTAIAIAILIVVLRQK